MTQIRTHAVASSNAGQTLDIETALEVLDMAHADVLRDYADVAALPYAAELHAERWEAAISRAVTVLARAGDPSDELEAAYALTCTSKR